MRETLISIMLLFVIVLSAKGTDLNKDGLNYYKDYLRSKPDETSKDLLQDRMLYFYRTPLRFYPDIPALQDYRKRTANLFKNYMLNREPEGIPNKRTSKTGLSLLMQSKQDLHPTDDDEHFCLYG